MARGNDVQLGGITDLVLLADIQTGFVDALEVATYVDRLRKVLRTLNGLRLGSRESSSPASPYTDIVGRWRIVHSFRWAVIDGVDGAPDRLLLNVIFDGGWEPYMRVIWDQLGSTLDLILCHTEGYELSCNCSFETYANWVRAHETSADFLFISSGRTVGDTEYLAKLEASQRGHANELKANRLRAPSSGQVPALPGKSADDFAMAARGLVPLAGLFMLQRYFRFGAHDGACLLRAAQDVLFELKDLGTTKHFPWPTGPVEEVTPGQLLRQRHHEMLAWFEKELAPVKPEVRKLQWDKTQLQAGMLTKLPANRGALLMLRIEQPAKALAWLATAPVQHEGQPVDGGVVWRQIALSLAGLKALGVPDSRLDRFPQAFKEGMAARAGLLGDVRHNHPAHWALAPHVNGRDRFDPAGAHLLVQVRFTGADDGEALSPADKARIEAACQELTRNTGLSLMAVEPMRSNSGEKENFGYKDGISQPSLDAVDFKKWNDKVPDGEILLGLPTLRDKGYPVPEKADALLDRGSFLVVRKLRQYNGRLHDRIRKEAKDQDLPYELLMAKMMGRRLDGKALADESTDANDFNYEHDGRGSLCPFHAHIRRANPRDQARDPVRDSALTGRMPRILRRGMSYGPPPDRLNPSDSEDRGLVFMAYNAHLAEQFEVVQRWMSGANASGGYSAQSDPLLGVADTSLGPRIYPFEHAGKPREINLGSEPFVTLQWGAYFFVPSIPALRALPALAELPLPLPAPTPVPARAPAPQDKDAWQRWLEDTTTRDAAWAWVRAQPGGVAVTAYGTLVGAADRVQDVLRNQPARYSVKGYGERMRDSIGEGFLGMDDDNGHKEQAPAVNKAIEEVSEAEAFITAYQVAQRGLGMLKAEAQALLAGFPPAQQPHDLPADTPLDLERLSEGVMAALCQHWFGLPDHKLMLGTEASPVMPEPPRCPRSLIRVSRHVFGPCPSKAASDAGRDAGKSFLAATTQWLRETPRDKWPALTKKIVEAAEAVPGATADLPARTLAGAMLGFPPTTHGNLLTVLAGWVQTRKLWDLQPVWHEVPLQASDAQRYIEAVARLRPTVIVTMNLRPTPFQLWRRALADHRLGQVDVKAGDTLIIGLGSATQQDPLRHHIVFGGDCADPAGPPPHACPGYAMGMGVMLGVIAAVLDAGVLRFTGSPTVVALAI